MSQYGPADRELANGMSMNLAVDHSVAIWFVVNE
jgi:hypothetical protein